MQIQTYHSWADPIPPWSTTGLWQAANHAMLCAVHRHRDILQDAVDLAQRIRSRIEALDPLMRDLCERTCPHCTDNCCRRATVWFDFKDLLCLHMARRQVTPPAQLVSAAHQTCRYMGDEGCSLPRTQRPFVCTWFICSTQKGVMNRWPLSRKQFLWNSLDALKKGRKKMEYMFIQAVTS